MTSQDKLTIKERKFLTEYVDNGGNGTQAALKAYDTNSANDAAVIASKVIKKPSVAEALKMELARQGITIENVIAPVAKGLKAVREDGTDDYRTQLAAHDRAVKIMGLAEPKENNPAINFNINKANFGGEFVQNEED
ncbi:terminase small subunit [Candidatus Saccharibacteria bacterium]|nr:terminase small subunit [Candidatus Saccharibacteria bacterium]